MNPDVKKLPVCVNIDDHAPLVHVYREHARSPFTMDGRPLLDSVPLEFFRSFCDMAEETKIKGKLSVVPMPGCRGDISLGLEGFERSELDEWLDGLKSKLAGKLSFGPEMLTHQRALELKSGEWLDENEETWSNSQDRTTLTPYIAKALGILKAAGITATGVTSPWMFGQKVEEEYRAAIAEAFSEVYGVKRAWYFMHTKPQWPEVFEPVTGFRLVSVNSTLDDMIWRTIDTPDTGEEFVKSIAELYVTEDGRGGKIPELVRAGLPVIILTHWQSLFSNGNQTGLRILRLVARRVNEFFADSLRWTSFEELIDSEEL